MLKIALDPSVIKMPHDDQKVMELSVSIAGVAADNDDVPDTKNKVKNLMYPWRWEFKPAKIRVYWLKEDNSPVSPDSYKDVEIISPADLEEDDKNALEAHYELILGRNLYNDQAPKKEEFSAPFEKGEEINYHIADEEETTPQLVGFFPAAIAQFSQKVSPLNEHLKLVFFGNGKEVEIPSTAKNFVAFPIETEPVKAPYREKESRFFQQDVQINGNNFMFYSDITELPDKNGEPLFGLRDEHGNFRGRVKPDVSENIDWDVNRSRGEGISGLKEPYDSPPPLRIEVPTSISEDKEEDLLDEIAGYFVLINRDGETRINSKPGSVPEEVDDWRYLNWAQPQIKEERGVAGYKFENDYLIPAFLAQSESEKQKPFLSLSNENLSLVAGHKAFSDEEEDTKSEIKEHLFYHFPSKPIGESPVKTGYALWYGHKYKFAAYVALNSGALPPEIRGAAWNLPNLHPRIDSGIVEYSHKRRVPVSKPRIEVVQSTDRTKAPLAPPDGLRPLAFELKEWEDPSENESLNPIEKTHFLLADSTGRYEQNSVTLNIRKPTTSFWNWYAWLGDDADADSGTGKSIAMEALTQELKARDAALDMDPVPNILCDPAVSNTFVFAFETLFSEDDVKKGWNYHVIDFEASVLEDPVVDLAVKLVSGSNSLTRFDGKTLQVKEGEIVRLKVGTLVGHGEFNRVEGKFYSWMTNFTGDDSINFKGVPAGYQVVFGDEVWFEAAKNPSTEPIRLWDNLSISNQRDNVLVHLNKDGLADHAYLGEAELLHQVWHWNGRLDNSEALLFKERDEDEFILVNDMDKDINHRLNPIADNNKSSMNESKSATTPAMNWEAWAFSDRPDYASMMNETDLVYSSAEQGDLETDTKQLLFTDHRPNEEKALYYRFGIKARSRYYKLGGVYEKEIKAEVPVDGVMNPWKRHIVKCKRSNPLPKPSVRFFIPLTKSIEECVEKVEAASMLIALDDKWFAEAGLAEKLEVGIDVVDDLRQGKNGQYIQAGNDPILYGQGLTEIINYDENDNKLVLSPIGPAGLTFEPSVQTPLLRGCSFILDVPNLDGLMRDPKTDESKVNRLFPWAMMQVAVRRNLRKPFCEDFLEIDSLKSEWSAKEWVQFLPAVNSLIPKAWTKQVAEEGYLEIGYDSQKPDTISILNTVMPEFPMESEFPKSNSPEKKSMERYLVLTEKINDLNGQPTEQYLATYKWEGGNSFRKNHLLDSSMVLQDNQFGYGRLLLVRRTVHPTEKDKSNDSIWDMLFGEHTKSGNINIDPRTAQKDPKAALPLVSGRLMVRFRNKN